MTGTTGLWQMGLAVSLVVYLAFYFERSMSEQ